MKTLCKWKEIPAKLERVWCFSKKLCNDFGINIWRHYSELDNFKGVAGHKQTIGTDETNHHVEDMVQRRPGKSGFPTKHHYTIFGSITYIKELSVISLNFYDTSTFRTHFCSKHSLVCHAGNHFHDQSCQTKPWTLPYASILTSEQIVLHKQGKYASRSRWSLLEDHIYVNPKWHVIYAVMALWFQHCVRLWVDINTASIFMMTGVCVVDAAVIQRKMLVSNVGGSLSGPLYPLPLPFL